MNTPSPLVPEGSLLEQKNKSRSRVKVAFFCVVGLHVVGLLVLLMQGCKREQPPVAPESELPLLVDTNLPAMDTNLPPVTVDTNVFAPPPLEVPPPAPAVQEYVIERGDSFYTIGRKLNVPWTAIRDANPNVNPSKLQIGQKIVIPAVTSPPLAGGAPGQGFPAASVGGEQAYVVKSGDTLTKIAREHATSVKALRSANHLKTDKIKVGDKLVIPAKVAVPVPEPAPVEVPMAPAPVPPTAPPGQ